MLSMNSPTPSRAFLPGVGDVHAIFVNGVLVADLRGHAISLVLQPLPNGLWKVMCLKNHQLAFAGICADWARHLMLSCMLFAEPGEPPPVAGPQVQRANRLLQFMDEVMFAHAPRA